MALFGNKKTTDKPAPKTVAPSMQDLYGAKAEPQKAAKIVKDGKGVKVGKEEKASTKTDSFKILVKPLVTEKATNLVAENKYAFIVAKKANKIEIAKAVKAVYGVTPIKVNVINMQGKRVTRGRIKGQRSDFRKAFVTLKKGEHIKLYEGV
jgi:large subunit ribosomal protein L23